MRFIGGLFDGDGCEKWEFCEFVYSTIGLWMG